jgi:hypothetical protein
MLVTALLSATAVLGQHGLPKPCFYPQQFTAQVHKFDYAKNLLVRSEVIYDAPNERVFEEEVFRGPDTGKTEAYDIIALYREKVKYKIDRSTRECFGPYPMGEHEHWNRFGVNPNASYHGQVTSGVPPNTYLVNQFGLRGVPTGPQQVMSSWAHVTAEECMPTRIINFATFSDGSIDIDKSTTAEFYDVVLGVEDPNVFIPPRDCKPPAPTPHPPPSTKCESVLKRLCGAEQGNRDQCQSCISEYAASITAAGCTRTDELKFCEPK